MTNPRVFIIGNPRSGTTLLRLILTSHSGIVIPPECGFIIWLFDEFKDWSVADSLNENSRKKFIANLLKCRKFDTWVLDPEVLDYQISVVAPPSYGDLCNTVYSEYGKKLGKLAPILGDKNNFHVACLDLLNIIYPDARFLHIVRDGRDIACSYREVMEQKSTSPYAPRLETHVELVADEWAKNVNRIDTFFDGIPSSRKATVRYEDLVVGAKEEVERICAWIGVQYEDHMLLFHKENKAKELEPSLTMDWKRRTLEPISNNTVGRYSKILSDLEINSFEEVAGDQLFKHGYLNKR